MMSVKLKKLISLAVFLLSATYLSFGGQYQVKSPDGKLDVLVQVDNKIIYTLKHQNEEVFNPSSISITLGDGRVLGQNSKVKSIKRNSINQWIESPFYKRKQIKDHYNELELVFRDEYRLIFRVYNEGMAYRFAASVQENFTVLNEEASFSFKKDFKAYIPYVNSEEKEIEKQFFNSFENIYTYAPLSEMDPNKLAFTPIVVDLQNGKKVCLAEADLEGYPGMYLINKDKSNTLTPVFAPYPKTKVQGGHNNLQQLVTSYEPYIAKCKAQTNFPWRVVIITTADKELADNDMIYKLAAPSRLANHSWIKPGKVAWEWWNNWGLYHVDFVAGINTQTYMSYIDFAARNGIEYVILDEGWAVKGQADLFQVVPEIDLKKLVAYANSKKVSLILWAGYHAFDREMERVCKHYSEMGIKGFKVDFMNRDDQEVVDFFYRAAETAAKYKLLLDFHGAYKPTGMNRTYPNVINFEAVFGLEQMKWTGIGVDQVTYDVTMPFIRMVAGPIDYTQGAMLNGTKRTYRANNDIPMSQGTRCRQLAEYVIFESPLNMLCDSPTLYEKEQECTNFISKIPTVWDQTIALNGEIGQYISIARKKGEVWYVGSLTNWDERTLDLDLSFLGEGNYEAEIFKDGANANKIATDYAKAFIPIPSNKKITVSMAKGGGCALRIYRK